MQDSVLIEEIVPLLMEDGGQFYAETNPSAFIVEPWNAVSSLLLILPALYWVVKLHGEYHQHVFISLCIPLLTLGGLGSTLFHAFRVSPFFLYMDVLPTAILTLALGVYFWQKVMGKWWLAVLIVLASLPLRLIFFKYLNTHTAINISYAITGVVIFVPILLIMFRTRMKKSLLVFAAIILLVLSLFFREMDAWEDHWLPMGTHFLWHTFSALGAFYLSKYLYFIDYMTRRKNKVANV